MDFKKTLICGLTALTFFGTSPAKSALAENETGNHEISIESVLSSKTDSFSVPLSPQFSILDNGEWNCSKKGQNFDCKKIKKRASFSFDDSRFSLGKKYSDSKILQELNGADGRIRLNALLGSGDFVVGLGAEHQAVMASLKVGLSREWDAKIIGSAYHINLDFRNYFGRKRNMFIGLGNDHLSNRLIEEDVNVKEFLVQHPEIKINLPVTDVVSLQFGHNYKINDRVSLEYLIGANLYQTTPVYMISALWDRSKHGENYPYFGFLVGKLPYKISEDWDIYASVQSELSLKKSPTNIMVGIAKIFAPYPFGLRIYGGWNKGRDKNTIEKTRFGIESNGALIMFEVFSNALNFPN